MRKAVLFVLAFLLFFIYSCTEIYEPEISETETLLVVEGLITNEPGPHLVRLTRTSKFGEVYRPNFLSNARISISDTENNAIFLNESGAGHYYTPEEFSGKIGETYTLLIETADGEVYSSTPQKMLSPVKVDSIYAEFSDQAFFYYSNVSESIIQREVDGVNLFFDVSRDDDRYPKFRFNSTLLLQYSWPVEPPFGRGEGPQVYDNCWEKRHIIEFLDGDLPRYLNKPDIKRNRVAFSPYISRNMRYLGFPIIGRDDTTMISYTHPRIVIKRIYTLTDEAYSFHQDRNKQISGDGSFFDPILPQLKGNISNVDDLDEVVLGIFEVSSAIKTTLNLRPMQHRNIIVIDKLECLDYVTNSGCIYDEYPDWWL